MIVSKLRLLGRGLLRLPGFRVLRPIARLTRLILEPPGHLFIRSNSTRPPVGDCEAITILSANLWHDWPRHRGLSERLETFASIVENERADILLLQEVMRTSRLRADELLADRLDMNCVYSRANGHERAIGFEEGLAILSRFPLVTPQLRQLGSTAAPLVNRLALGATLETPCGDMSAFSVHLSLFHKRNASQLSQLRAWVGAVSGQHPAIIGGDFNAHEKTRQISEARSGWLDTFRHINPFGDGATHEVRWPWGSALRRVRLDYIFFQPGARSWKVLDARHVQPEGRLRSDHRAVYARLAPDSTTR